MQCLGGNGYINGGFEFNAIWRAMFAMLTWHGIWADYPMGRFLRDSRLYTVGAGTQEIRRMLIGREFNEQFKA